MQLLAFLRTQVRANRLANHRLHQAMALLGDAEMRALRTSFFPSLISTLDHLLWVDTYYIDCLHALPGARERALAWLPFERLPPLAAAQATSDQRLITLLDGIGVADLDRIVEMPRRDRIQREPFGNVVAHLVNHQVHHRGQVHAMLSGTDVVPPQLDEFLMSSEAHLRHADMAALGWAEADLFAAAPVPG